MADILLANSYFLKHDAKEHKAMNLYAPLGTLYAASYLIQKGYDVKVFDTMLAENENELSAELKKYKPKVFVIYDDVFNYLTKMCLSRMREAAFKMAQIAKEFGCTVIVSGSDAEDHKEKYFNNSADYIISGEGEIALEELTDSLLNSVNNFREIDGISYIDNGKIVSKEKRKVIKDLDTLPFPARELIDIDGYKERWYKKHGIFSMNIVTTRGCPYHCNWCAKPIYGQVYNSRSPENVVKEMKMLSEVYHPDHLWFCDDIFGLKPGWMKSFSEELKKQGVRIPFKCLSRADLLLKEDNITDLAQSGCESIWIGAESGSQKILDAMEKGTTIEEITEARKLLKKHNIKTCFFLQFGYTGETKKEINQTLDMVRKLMPDDIGISVSYPLPGTKFYEKVSVKMGEKKNWTTSGDFDMMFDGTYPTKFYRNLHKTFHKEFRTRQVIQAVTKLGIGNENRGRLKNLWKLPFYVGGWMWNSLRLKWSDG